MHLLTRAAIQKGIDRFPQHAAELTDLRKTIEKGYFKTPEDLRKVIPTLDNHKHLDHHYVINVGWNELRLLALIFFQAQKFYVVDIMTHKEYDAFNAKHKGKKKR